jgi:anaerobic ribonucleoside-triphosphate reductase activating protein
MLINVHSMLSNSGTNGPGNRFVLWVQGCERRCVGCWNSETLSHAPCRLLTVEQVFQHIQKEHVKYRFDGVTISGGEPFLQDESLTKLAQKLKLIGLNILVFTGYYLEELTTPSQQEFLQYIDWLIDGPFDINQKVEGLTLRGSRNQHIRYLSEESKAFSFDNEETPVCEMHIDSYGKIILSGFPTTEIVKFVQEELQ